MKSLLHVNSDSPPPVASPVCLYSKRFLVKSYPSVRVDTQKYMPTLKRILLHALESR